MQATAALDLKAPVQEAVPPELDEVRPHDYTVCSTCRWQGMLLLAACFGLFPVLSFAVMLGLKSFWGTLLVVLAWLSLGASLRWTHPFHRLMKKALQERLDDSPMYPVMVHDGPVVWLQQQTEAMIVVFERSFPELQNLVKVHAFLDSGRGPWFFVESLPEAEPVRNILREVEVCGYSAFELPTFTSVFELFVDPRATDPESYPILAAEHLRERLGSAYSPNRVEMFAQVAKNGIPVVVAVQWRTAFTYQEPTRKPSSK